MEDRSIASRTQQLRRQILQIQRDELSYRSHRFHSLDEIADHNKREFRVLAIREELRTLIDKGKQRLSEGSVWYS